MSKAETQALTNYGSGEDENEDEEIEEFEEGPVDVQTSLQANTDAAEENELDAQVLSAAHRPAVLLTPDPCKDVSLQLPPPRFHEHVPLVSLFSSA